MVMLTDDAATAIRGLTQQAPSPEGAGLRIASDATNGELKLHVATGPEQGDAVVESSGAKLFLDPVAVGVLDGKALDAMAAADGQIQFTVSDHQE